jgi:hypothetical protein
MIDCLPQNQKNEETENTKFQKAGEVLYFKKVFRGGKYENTNYYGFRW